MSIKRIDILSFASVALLMALLAVPSTLYLAQAQTTPSIAVLSPAGALNTATVVSPDFVVSFTVKNFELMQPGVESLANNPNQGHIHVFLDGTYILLWTNSNPIPFNGVAPGNHTIKLELVNNDHSAFSPEISQTIDISVTNAPLPLKSPALSILSPAGSLNTNGNVASTFAVSFVANNFALTEPHGQPNALNTGHIHVYIDGTYYVLWTTEAPIPFYDLSVGQHTIKLELQNNDHSVLSPEVSQTITVNVQAGPSTTVDLSPVQNSVNNVMYIAIVAAVLIIIVLIMLAAYGARMMKKM